MHRNNFDLIRLLAALQVALMHGERYLISESSAMRRILDFLPGVPIFFFISGFLISASFYRSTSIWSFGLKRFLRIFPALWLCILCSAASLWAFGYFRSANASVFDVLVWICAQLTIFQFYNPDFARHYGAGIVNPSLWTIAVEIQFYLSMPVLAWLFRSHRRVFLSLLLGLLSLSAVYTQYLVPNYSDSNLRKLLGVSLLPWVGMFMIGVVAQLYWSRIKDLFEGKLLVWLFVYLVFATAAFLIESKYSISLSGNAIVLPLFLPLSCLVLALAYNFPALSEWLNGNDISYGLYIWHMPIIGTWLYFGGRRDYIAVATCVATSVAIALLSWLAVEKRVLNLKSSIAKA